MNVLELGEYCSSINIDCDICIHSDKCKKFTELLEEVSPCGFLNLARNMGKQSVD